MCAILKITRWVSAKYLGITITKDVKWKTRIDNISAKAKTPLEFVKRNVLTR